ncbi:MAG: hypothetical protein ACJASM_001307 [Salibacteraceae bacterium]|jgi:hypothetical protein
MSLHDIDRLVKSAFRTEEYSYKNKYWKDLESRLGASKSGGSVGKVFGALAVLIAGLSVSTDQLNIEQSTTSSQYISEIREIKNGNKSMNLPKENLAFIGVEIQPDNQNTFGNNTFKKKPSSTLSIVRDKNESIEPSAHITSSLEEQYLTANALLSQENKSIQRANSETFQVEKTFPSSENISLIKFSKINAGQIASISLKPTSEDLARPLADETEFGGKIKQSSITQYFIQGGAYYLQLNPNIVDQNNIPENFEKEFKSFGMSGGEILVGIKRKGFKIASGIGVSSISKTFAYKFSEENISTAENINSTNYLDNVDSSFSHYEINEFQNNNNSNFDIGASVYQVDSNFITVTDTIRTTSKEVIESNIALAYQLNYLNIPIQIGYEIDIKRFFVDISAAIQLGVLTNYNGYKYNDKAEGSKTIITSTYLNPVTLSYSVAVGAGYNITPTISVIAQPVYSSTLVGAFKNIKPNKIAGFGGKLALQYQF